jgi:putative restriction endonuclease
MRFWWVNQNQTYQVEVPGGFLWSPKTRADGARNYFYETMTEVVPGDLVFSFKSTFIKAIGVVQRQAYEVPKPAFGGAGENWSASGWLVETEFYELPQPFKPKDFMELIGPKLNPRYAPLQANGAGLQGVYLTEISEDLGKLLISLSSAPMLEVMKEFEPLIDEDSEYEIAMEINEKHLEGDLEKIQIVKSRRGQGLFKANVRLIEEGCRVTGVTEIKHLRASHIKPWSQSDNKEKLDGSNGLLLSPHVDHLFDRGFISFTQKGELLISNKLNCAVLDDWEIEVPKNVGNFSTSQEDYLSFHRARIFKAD